jgi:hypothetical protein
MEWLEAKQQRNVNMLFIESIGSTIGCVAVHGAGQPMTDFFAAYFRFVNVSDRAEQNKKHFF